MRGPCDADSFCYYHGAAFFSKSPGARIRCDEERSTGIAKVNSIQSAINIHGFAKLRWAVGQRPILPIRPLLVHEIPTKGRLDGTNQYSLANSPWTANGIHAKMASINEVDVAVTRRPKHHPIALRQTWGRVARRIIVKISFRFHDRPTYPAGGRIANQPMPQQSRRNRFSRRRIKRTWQRLKISRHSLNQYPVTK
jgi:hypothetical protein